MGNKALIGIERIGGIVECIYCNFDGCIVRGVGVTLLETFSTKDSVDSLMIGGDCISIVEKYESFGNSRKVPRYISIGNYAVGLYNTRFIYLFKNESWFFKSESVQEWTLITEYLKNEQVCKIYY